MAYQVRLYEIYKTRIVSELIERFNYKNVMQAPRLEKIVLSRGIGAAVADKKLLEQASSEFALISGQKAIITKSKQDISNFKLRKGAPIGCKVTLRQSKMYEFLDRFINVAAPRMRDFRGFNDRGFDGKGNYNLAEIGRAHV